MNIEEFRESCLSLKGVTESFPFDASTLVYKVMGKMFTLTDLEEAFKFSFKSDPETTAVIREKYSSVVPARYMNKKYWSCVMVDGSVDDSTLKEWIFHSYRLVVAGLPRSIQQELSLMK